MATLDDDISIEDIVAGLAALGDLGIRTLDDGILISTYSWGELMGSYDGQNLLEALDKALRGEGFGSLVGISDRLSERS